MAKPPVPVVRSTAVDAFLRRAESLPALRPAAAGSARLLFAVDATASRQPTWDRAVAVQTVPTKSLHPSQQHSKTYRARKQIIVSGGTLSSPLILQRSGIGKFCKHVHMRQKLTASQATPTSCAKLVSSL